MHAHAEPTLDRAAQHRRLCRVREVLQLDIQGTPQAWISVKEACGSYATEAVAWTIGEVPLAVLRGGFNVMLGCDSVIEVHPIIALRGAARVNLFDATPTLTKAKLVRRDRFTCAYCGGRFVERDLTCEHIVPRSKGGAYSWMNLVAACRLWPPKNLPVGCVSEFRIRSREKNPVGGTRGHHQFGLRVRGRV